MISPQEESGKPVRFGTRGSALALAQTDLAMARFRAVYPDRVVEPRVITTQGDLDKHSPLTEIGGRGVFTSALETALLAHEIDAAVHSAKDLPTGLHPDAPIVAYPDRADPRDALVSRHGTTLDRLPRNPVIGTSSRRRAVQIARLRPDAQIVDVRGNIDTRLRKAAGAEFDAIVLAAAGLRRMGWDERVTQYFSCEELTPSPGQGALAVQAKRGSEIAAVLELIDDVAVSEPVGIERAFLRAIGAGCTFPVGAHAVMTVDGYRLYAMLADEGGERIAYADELLAIGEEVDQAAVIAERMRAEVKHARRQRKPNCAAVDGRDLAGVRVVVTRPRRQAGPLLAALRARGATPLPLPLIRIEPMADTSQLDARLREVEQGAFDWLVFSSANAVEVCAARLMALGVQNCRLSSVNVAAVGPATAAAAEAVGLSARLVPETATAEGLAAAMIRVVEPTARVLYPRSAIGREALPSALREAGIDVVAVAVYRTLPEEEIDGDVLEQARRGEIDVITISSPSGVRNLLKLLGTDVSEVTRVPVVCTGPETGWAARNAGFAEVVIGGETGAEAMADAVAEVWRTRAKSPSLPSGPRPTVAAAGDGSTGRSGD